MSRHRNRLEIIADILRTVRKGAKKTNVMRQARLSYTLLCRYLTEVVNTGLVYYENGNYVVTRKGNKFLDKFNVYSQHCKHLKDHLNTVNSEEMELEKMCR